MDLQTHNSQNVENAEKAKTVISSNEVVSRSRGQPMKVFERKDTSAEREGGRISDPGERSQNRSESRTISPK